MVDLKTVYGAMSVPDSPDDLIVRALALHGEWALAEPMLLAPMVRSGDRIWDVGAYLGTFGIGLVQNCGVVPASLLVVEPNPDILAHLRLNIERNASCQARIVSCVVGADATFFRRQDGADESNAGSISYEPTALGGGIASRSLASLRAEFGDYDILKLDIEGMENTAIRSDIEFLKLGRTVIWAECNETQNSILLLEALVWLGYKPVYVAFPAFRTANFKNSTEKIYEMAYEAALFAAPADRQNDFIGQLKGEEIIVKAVETSFDLRKAMFATPRWAMPEWTEKSRVELIALLGRTYLKQDLVDFLNV